MAISKWVYRLSDGIFVRGGSYDASYNPNVEGLVEFSEIDPHPNVILHRFDAVLGKRLATPQELTDAKNVIVDAQAQTTSRQKDVLTTCALVVRARGIAAWNAMTTQQKVTAALAEADAWKTMRTWVEANL